MTQEKGIKALNPIDSFPETRLIAFRAYPFFSGKNPTRLPPVKASLQVSSLQASTHAQTNGHGRVHLNIALAAKLNYLKLIYCLHRQICQSAVKIALVNTVFSHFRYFFRLVIGKTHVKLY